MGEFECIFCRTTTDEQPISCPGCGELKCPTCMPGGAGVLCLDCEEHALCMETDCLTDVNLPEPYGSSTLFRHGNRQ